MPVLGLDDQLNAIAARVVDRNVLQANVLHRQILRRFGLEHEAEIDRVIDVHVLHHDVLKVSVATEEPDGPEVLIIVDLVVGPNAGPEIPAGAVQRDAVNHGVLVAEAQRIVAKA
ncbi:hypothetical protein D3C81_1191370 [compost metagenome]